MKKILVLMMVVAGVHCVAITALFLVQGCKTTKKPAEPSAVQAPMPPLTEPSIAPAKVETAEPAGKAEETTEYIVKSGDSLGVIAKRHKVSKAELAAANKLADPGKIRVGQKLVIPKHTGAVISPPKASLAPAPKPEKAAKPKEKKTEPAPSLAAGINEYVVEAGDSLSKISAKLKVSVSELRDVNKLISDKLKIGQKLIIPAAKKAEGAPSGAAPTTAVEPVPEAPVKSAPSSGAEPAVTSNASAGAATPAKTSDSGVPHVVMSEYPDLDSIAKLYTVRVEDIVAANKLGTNRTLRVGQKIIIP